MNRYRMRFAPQVWKPKLNPLLVRCLRPLRVRNQQRTQQLVEVAVAGAETVRSAVDDGCGVMIMPNHASHADPFSIYAAADTLRMPIHGKRRARVQFGEPIEVPGDRGAKRLATTLSQQVEDRVQALLDGA